MKKETVYTMPYETEADMKAAEDLRAELYETYNSVQVYPNGLYEVRIVASDETTATTLAKHPQARYIDCAVYTAAHCRKCGWTR